MSHGFIPIVFMNRVEHITVHELTVTRQYTRVTEEVRLVNTANTARLVGYLDLHSIWTTVHIVTSDELCDSGSVV